ncbi:lipase [Daedalea quercina L-15889]|uniref:Lipase n=1 Tax=Daedalea quercina L-15889 TaxID=1314783 RepID=A0A165QCM0_9APHY|nr:lipase [Daedalea quercina L-15889]
MPLLTLAVALLAALPASQALPASFHRPRAAITTLSTAQISSFKPYTSYASAAYCTAANTLAWNCGANCQANPSFIPTASGGDGDATQFWFVGYDPTLDTVIVAHQGTDPEEILPLIEDADVVKDPLSSTLFPGINSSISAHSGFANAQASTATQVLAAVQQTMSNHSTTKVTLVGHSLGAAISLLDTVYLHLNLPAATLSYVGYGLPRVGNQAFADYVDALGASVTHINNKEDFVPILPGMFLGFVHPAGEVHIEDSGAWAACPGQDNGSTECIVGDVPTIFSGVESDHDGPYGGVTMGC